MLLDENFGICYSINHDDFYGKKKQLCFVKQPHSEVSILIKANFIYRYLYHTYPKSQGQGNPANVTMDWPYEWTPAQGYARLRLSELNGNDGKTFCNWNIGPVNKSDYIKCEDPAITKDFIYSILHEQDVQNRLESLVDLTNIRHIEPSPEELSISDMVYMALVENRAEIVVTNKWVFCLKPRIPTSLDAFGIQEMTNIKTQMYHHRQKIIDNVRIGFKDGHIKVPCVDTGGLSNLSYPIDNSAHEEIFNEQTMKTCPFTDEESITGWVSYIVNTYQSSRNCSQLSDSELVQFLKSIWDLYNEY